MALELAGSAEGDQALADSKKFGALADEIEELKHTEHCHSIEYGDLRDSYDHYKAENKELRAALVKAVEAMSLPCDRWNSTQTDIVNAALTKCKEVLK
jgi:hypothetical protein